MPIHFKELEQILKNWKNSLKLRKTDFNELVINYLEEDLKKNYIKQINNLFENIDQKDIYIKEEYDTSRTYGRLHLVENVVIKKRSAL